MSTSERQDEDRQQMAVLSDLRQAIDSIAPVPAADGQEPDSAALADDPEYRKAKKRALNMLAARDHASAELRSKLLSKEHPTDVVDALIDRLQASKLLDDENYAQAFVRSHRSRRALSKSALRRELGKKGVPEPAVQAAVEDIDDEFDVAFGVALKKARTTKSLPEETRLRRILAMLARRGFPQGVSMAAARRALDEV